MNNKTLINFLLYTIIYTLGLTGGYFMKHPLSILSSGVIFLLVLLILDLLFNLGDSN